MITVLVGGVGGAKLALGFARILPPEALTVVVNTADDLEWHGLYVAPDVDTVLYSLAGLADPQTGWGIAGDTTTVLDGLRRYGMVAWFRIGDRDLATHIARTEWLHGGMRYSEVVTKLARGLGIRQRVLPMSDQPVQTVVHTVEGDMAFQEYFVRRRTAVAVTGFSFVGLDAARPSQEVVDALTSAEAVIIGPSNPFVSIGPILAMAGVRDLLREGQVPCVAVSPIVGGRALRGPADRMLRELGHDSSAAAVARLYADLLDGFVIDVADASLRSTVESLGMQALVTETVMQTMADRERVAHDTLAFARTMKRDNH